MRHEIWARVVTAALDAAVCGGASRDALFAGVPFDAARLSRLRFVAWNDYCTIMEHIADELGDDFGDIAEANYHLALPELRALVGAIVSPKAFYRFVVEVVNPIALPPVFGRVVDLGGDRIRVECELRPGVQPCEPFFRGSVGAMRGLPHHLGMPPAQVLEVGIAADRMELVLALPPSRTLVTRALRFAVDFVLGHDGDGTPITITMREGGDSIDARLDRATLEWQLTPRQAEVLRWVVHGDANKDIAKALGCAESTIELHVTQLLRRSGAGSRTQLVSRFWTM